MLSIGEFGQSKSFLQLLVARFFGSGANQMLMVAAAWQMYDLTGSAWDLGLIGLCQFVPVLCLTLPAGHAADRFKRTHIVAAAIAVQGLCAAILLAATLDGLLSRGLLIGVSFLLGGATTFQRPAQQSLVGNLVPVALLSRAMALSSSFMQTAIIGGPALAGALFAFGGAAVYGTASVFLVASFVLVLRVDYAFERGRHGGLDRESLLAGVRFVRANPVLLSAISLDLLAVLLGGATALLPIYARDILHVGASGLGVLRSAPAVGALLMSVALSRRPFERGIGRRLLGAVAVYGACMLVFGISREFYLSLAALAVSGAADMVSVVVRQTLVQSQTPDDMRGRVGAVSSMFIGASNQLGEFESGATAGLFGPVASVVLGGVGTICVVALWWRIFPALVRQETFHRAPATP